MDFFYCAIVLSFFVKTLCKRVGLVDEQSMPAYLLLPRSGPTVSWLRRSKPGQVFAVLQMENRKPSYQNSIPSEPPFKHSPAAESMSVSSFYKTKFSKFSKLTTMLTTPLPLTVKVNKDNTKSFHINNGHHQSPLYYGNTFKQGDITTTATSHTAQDYRTRIKHVERSKLYRRPGIIELFFTIYPTQFYLGLKRLLKRFNIDI